MHHETSTALATVPVGYLWLIVCLPLAGALFNLFWGKRVGNRVVSLVAPGVIFFAFLLACRALSQVLTLDAGSVLVQHVYQWIAVGNLQIDVAFQVDALSAIMIMVITGVGFLIHVYSVGYMHDEPMFARYFTYLNLFTSAMLILVLADSLPLLFVGWEGVGVCSYLLIGFWFSETANADAGKKAFIVNRVGDAGFLLGLFLIFWNLGDGPHSLSFQDIAANVGHISPGMLTVIALLLFVGATGKSAQLPLYVWLPDAMAGPTPVSALIHAATMVTAGVYLIARLNFLYILAPAAMMVVAIVGACTALFAATIGLMQTDIKKVLAYSTVSQLGYMFLAVGVGAFNAGVFHLMTHAFFKGLLFLGSGSVIHGMSGEQDMRKMGGLMRYQPVTFITFFIGTLAIAGIPGLAGFFSKDLILASAMANGHPVLWFVGVVTAGLTSFYMFRLVFMTFFGECRADEETRHHIHESPMVMLLPLIILAILSIVGGYVGLPLHWMWGDQFSAFLQPVFGAHHGAHLSETTEIILMAISVGAGVIGLITAFVLYVLNPKLPDRIAAAFPRAADRIANKYYVDEIYDAYIVQPIARASKVIWQVLDVGIIDGTVNGSAALVRALSERWRYFQSGNVHHYAVATLTGAVVLLIVLAL